MSALEQRIATRQRRAAAAAQRARQLAARTREHGTRERRDRYSDDEAVAELVTQRRFFGARS